jgi:hypothetical protein
MHDSKVSSFCPKPTRRETITNRIFLLLVNIPDLSQFLMPRMQLHNVQSGMQLQQQFSAKTIKFIVMLDISIDCNACSHVRNSQICFHSAQHDNMMVVGKVLLPLPPQILQAWQLVLHNDSCQNKNCRNTLSSPVGARGIGLKIYREWVSGKKMQTYTIVKLNWCKRDWIENLPRMSEWQENANIHNCQVEYQQEGLDWKPTKNGKAKPANNNQRDSLSLSLSTWIIISI